MNETKIRWIKELGEKSCLRPLLIRHLKGEKLTRARAMRAKCCECMGYFADGRMECGIPACPLYPFMPYNPGRKKGSPKAPGSIPWLRKPLKPRSGDIKEGKVDDSAKDASGGGL